MKKKIIITLQVSDDIPNEVYGESSIYSLDKLYDLENIPCSYEVKEECCHDFENIGASRCCKCGKLAL